LNDLRDCEEAGINVFMPIPAFNPTKNVGVPEPEFGTEHFVYDSAKDVYVCPVGKELGLWKILVKGKPELGRRLEVLFVLTVLSSAGVLGIGLGAWSLVQSLGM
jgi:hypothetical protein